MRRGLRAATVLLLATLFAHPPAAGAASYFPLVHHQPADETAQTAGKTVYLFHSGTDDVVKALRPGDLLRVERISAGCEAERVGSVRVVAHLGETYLVGEVTEGSVKVNDIARLGKVACLVLGAQPCGRR